ncbi:MAG: hypothetical protein D6776_09665 [Planctomycetota bacterium]|nr:MAG: hypothetical protein D6776_09665 [Planctomycetota bacterium]
MNVRALRIALLVLNLGLIALIAWIAWDTFGPVDWNRWSVEPPELRHYTPPSLAEDPKQKERRAYLAIARAFERAYPEQEASQTTAPAPPPPPPPPTVSQLQVRLLQYDVHAPEASSALLYDPRSQKARFFTVGMDLGEPGLGFERYKGTRVRSISPREVVLEQPSGKRVTLPAPSGGGGR